MAGLRNRIAIVTGGSTGIGAATARALGSAGCNVVIDYLGAKRDAAKVCADIARLGSHAIMVKADISTEAGVAKVFRRCRLAYGPPHILINNAGIDAEAVLVADMSLAQWNRTLRVNLTGSFLCSRAFVRERKGKKGLARIVNISSVHEEIVFRGYADYDASKAGLLALTRTLALEVAASNITVNAVAPGMILTAMNEQAVRNPAILKKKTRHIPLRRAGAADEIAAVVVFLCSEAASYVTGASLRADGGLSLNTGQGA